MSHRQKLPLLLSLSIVIAFAMPLALQAALTLTAEAYDTPGLPGYLTYDITATIEDGFLNTYGFYGEVEGRSKGINGRMHQKGSTLGGSIFTGQQDDSGFLVDTTAGINIFSFESDDSLGGVFSYTGIGGQRQSYRSWTFARIVTDTADEVELLGELVAERHFNDGSGGELYELGIDTLLSDILLGPAPSLGDFPSPPVVAAPVLPPEPPTTEVIVVPPVVEPPIVSILDPPVVEELIVIVPDLPVVFEPPILEIEGPVTTPDDFFIELYIDEYPGGLLRSPTYHNQNTEFFAIDIVDSSALPIVVYDSDVSLRYADFDGITFGNIATGNVATTSLAAEVPEPSAALLLVLGAMALAPTRCRS